MFRVKHVLMTTIFLVASVCTTAHGLGEKRDHRPPRISPLYRFFGNGDHFLTANYQEGVNARYAYEGIAFYVWNAPVSQNMIPIYRCYANGDHMVSTSPNCEGYAFEG